MLTRGRCLKPNMLKFNFYKNEFESLKAQLANLNNKTSKPVNHAQLVQASRSREGPPRLFYGLSHDAMVGEYVLSCAHNSSLTPEFVTYFYLSHFATQEASVASRTSPSRQIIQIDGFTSSSNPFTKATGARTIMPQFFCPLNTKEECTLLARGEETTTPQAIRASNSCVPGIHV
jgi:hypothetical protein